MAGLNELIDDRVVALTVEKVNRLHGEGVVGEYVLPQLGRENPQVHVLRLKPLELDRQLSRFEAA
ncbi:hypothetical protein R6V09_00380 [Streptomyces sp. W16]|uniref:hypothetical protein n=1 Tax=Streptomyces sp. W16 TaxID=3076631 RepID=UPI00295C0604|nr:hypothetical protein [Streptomyces sp. W16]MDV9168599.1 hypothetical protein [Streptomyces sp. W16]